MARCGLQIASPLQLLRLDMRTDSCQVRSCCVGRPRGAPSLWPLPPGRATSSARRQDLRRGSDVLRPYPNIKGGDHDTVIEYVSLGLVTRVEVESGDSEYSMNMEFHRIHVAGSFTLPAKQQRACLSRWTSRGKRRTRAMGTAWAEWTWTSTSSRRLFSSGVQGPCLLHPRLHRRRGDWDVARHAPPWR